MIEKISFPSFDLACYQEVIDVRAPVEFVEDHISGAVNLPVLSDEERVKVGTIYKQVSPFEARKIGAALVSKNIATHLECHFAKKDKAYRPLIYCWRGGQRSGSLATVLNDVGWATAVIEGGYRAYRGHVLNTIRERTSEFSLIVLNGFTGAGKTLVLKSLQEMGQQVLDLEGLACHKGSVFGGDPENPQPAQKRFESQLFDRISKFDVTRPVFVEAESAKIGRLNLPNPLWQRMKVSPVVEIRTSLEARARYLTDDYHEWLSDPARVRRTIDRLKGFHADKTLATWKEMADRGEWETLVTRLLAEHYDHRYSVGGSGHFECPGCAISLPDHETSSVRACAEELIATSARLIAAPVAVT